MCLVLVPVALSGCCSSVPSSHRSSLEILCILGWMDAVAGDWRADDDRVHCTGLVARAHKGPVAFTQVLGRPGVLD